MYVCMYVYTRTHFLESVVNILLHLLYYILTHPCIHLVWMHFKLSYRHLYTSSLNIAACISLNRVQFFYGNFYTQRNVQILSVINCHKHDCHNSSKLYVLHAFPPPIKTCFSCLSHDLSLVFWSITLTSLRAGPCVSCSCLTWRPYSEV